MLNKITRSVIILGSIFSLSACTIAKPAAPERYITVNGTGSVSVKADMVSLKFQIRTMDWNVNKAVDKNSEITNKVLEAVKGAGVDSNDIATVNYGINQDLSKNIPGQYTVRNTISVIIRNTSITGNVIDAAIVAGANGLVSFQYMAEDNTTALRQARTLAVQNAQDAANLLAGASGCKVGEVMEINENYSSRPTEAKAKLTAEAAMDFVNQAVQDGYVNVESNVTIRYTIE